MNGFSLKKGDSTVLFVLTIINAAVFAVWDAAYIICALLRDAAFTTTQTNMQLTGQAEYVITIDSPAYAVLKTVIYVLPVILVAWSTALVICERKNRKLCSGWFLIATFAADFLAAIFCAADIVTLNMIF